MKQEVGVIFIHFHKNLSFNERINQNTCIKSLMEKK